MAEKTLKGKFKPSTAAELQFYRQLKRVAQASGHLIDTHANGARIENNLELQKQLKSYSEKLGPWATRQSLKMLDKVQKANRRAYRVKSKTLGIAFKEGVGNAEVGMTAASLLFEQVDLIKSIPLEAGLRAQKIAFRAALEGTRAQVDTDTVSELEKQMGMSTEVATSRAMLIARTETARATAAINESRARSVGSNQYRWHNSGDAAVRDSHKFYQGKKLQGMIFDWNHPPTLSDGMTGHPGTFPNCRCFAEPIFEDE
jgi:SPP1 gp7 family putative phage head morphogenesis protein